MRRFYLALIVVVSMAASQGCTTDRWAEEIEFPYFYKVPPNADLYVLGHKESEITFTFDGESNEMFVNGSLIYWPGISSPATTDHELAAKGIVVGVTCHAGLSGGNPCFWVLEAGGIEFTLVGTSAKEARRQVEAALQGEGSSAQGPLEPQFLESVLRAQSR